MAVLGAVGAPQRLRQRRRENLEIDQLAKPNQRVADL
jgi:hypothetical protein